MKRKPLPRVDVSCFLGTPAHLPSGLAKAQMEENARTRSERSLSGASWKEVVAEQAARAVVLKKEKALAVQHLNELRLKVNLLEHDLVAARKAANRVVELEEQITRLSKSTKKYKGWWKRAVRCVLASGKDWRQVAIAEQAALRICVAERDEAKKALVETTATMNRYFGDWKSAVAQVSDLQSELSGREKEWSFRESSWAATHEFFEKYFGRDGSHVRFSVESELYVGAMKRLIAAYDTLLAQGAAPTSSGADAPPLEGGTRGEEETVGTLRGRLRGVSEGLDAEKRGRLAAEAKIDELEGRLAAERKAAELAVSNVSARHATEQDALRSNFLHQLQGLRTILADKEREAWHGVLMTKALTFDMPAEELERIKEECWQSMKVGVDGMMLSPGGAIVAVPEPVAEVSTTDVEAASPQLTIDNGQWTTEEEPAPRCASCGDELALSERGYITPKGARYCEPCYDVHLQARLDPCAVKGGAA